MAILVDEHSRVIVQGATGTIGRAFAERLARYYPNFVGGVSPGRGGQTVGGRPVFDSVEEAVRATGANASVVVVPARFAPDAVLEAVDAGIRVISIYTDLIPIHQVLHFLHYARARGTRIIGPNAAGVVSPGLGSIAELNDAFLRPGDIGIVSKSGSLTYEVIAALNEMGWGQSTICCLGGDPVIGTRYADVLTLFEQDPKTRGVVLLGEVGGQDEVEAARVIREMSKPVVAYVAGHSAPPGKQMGHAGAIVSGDRETARVKSEILKEAGAHVAALLEDVPPLMARTFSR